MEDMLLASHPLISVVIPTRNRPNDVRRCLDSLSKVTYPEWDIVVVDQSDNDDMAQIVQEFADTLPRLAYHHQKERGVSRARNTGLSAATGDIIAFLDDDCTVEPDWLNSVANVFGRYPQATLVFGSVKSVPHDEREYFVPAQEFVADRVLRGTLAILKPQSMGASMYLRHVLTRDIVPFDDHLGAGAEFRSYEERDYSYRLRAMGKTVLYTGTIHVRHHGARSYRNGEASRLVRAAPFGQGAADMKLLRCGDPRAVALIAAHIWLNICEINPLNMLSQHGPTRFAWIIMYLRGLLASFQLPVDRRRYLYADVSPNPMPTRTGQDISDPHVTVCICTRDRGSRITNTLSSIANSSYQNFDVVVVDQSTSHDSEHALHNATEHDGRFRYIRTQSVGLSAARNIAIAHAQGPIVAFTDDDCEVPRHWLERIVAYFERQLDVGQILGTVQAGPHDADLGFIPDYHITRHKRISSPWSKWREGGIGANMAFRLEALHSVGPFDEVLGAGSPLYTCEDGDMTYRMLKAGYTVLNEPDVYVIHQGFRAWTQGRVLMRHTGLGVAAAYMKHLRLGDIAVLPTLLIEWLRCISWYRLLRLQRHSGLGRFLGYVQGMTISFCYPIDRKQRTYRR